MSAKIHDFFNQVAGNPEEREALNGAITDDIVKYAASKGFNITSDEVNEVLSSRLSASAKEAGGTSIGWS